MTDILNYVNYNIDTDDLAQCCETFEPSDKYWELQKFMDRIMENMDIHYLYIIIPLDPTTSSSIYNVLSADTTYGRQYDPDGYYLGFLIDDMYTSEEVAKYYNAMLQNDISFFEIKSGWGDDYSGCLPLKDSSGKTYALLCVDIEFSEIHKTINSYTFGNIILILFLGLVFAVLFLLWVNSNITHPIIQLEESVGSFAALAHENRDPEMLNYYPPEIHTHNEVEELSRAINQMSTDIKTYAQNILEAENQVQDMKSQVTRMDMLAYQDSLTHVKNKTWYDTIKARVDEDIRDGIAEFAIIMADFNNLKFINDTYGHECGNSYIVGGAKKICDICPFSAVFRIGGDEFVILLETKAYEIKELLFHRLIDEFDIIEKDESREPWERYSVAFGMAVFSEGDTCMDDVFKRADKMMYDNKTKMKELKK
ncbi:diguanylate cyclase (GGDEF) domain-containing protein [Pseudobutyrivibrio sp. YE44]|uniref:GGDEF domain-containing protein n=1 Tax=Pseudobutyrivibrio sp. YE44 TaxID=1520802 RepID=UPI000889AFD1|nr:diguanylate cyclase [Pseudobutyrivibrio sp. YE44]SDB24461.1 diguanylate cyclase (GGDEF) domain-containing protein [Pseudobutyrivibrio sp. YE44]